MLQDALSRLLAVCFENIQQMRVSCCAVRVCGRLYQTLLLCAPACVLVFVCECLCVRAGGRYVCVYVCSKSHMCQSGRKFHCVREGCCCAGGACAVQHLYPSGCCTVQSIAASSMLWPRKFEAAAGFRSGFVYLSPYGKPV